MRRYWLIVIALLLASACGNSTKHDKHHDQYGAVYVSDGHAYTRTYNESDDSFIWYLLYLNNQPFVASSPRSVVSSALTSGSPSWRSTSAPAATSLQQTTQSVKTGENGEPEADPEAVVANEDVPEGDAVVDESTTEDQAQTDVGDNSGDNSDGGSSGSGDGGGSDSGGSDSGGDSGGSDAGGGGDF